jgi:hypothetical protein
LPQKICTVAKEEEDKEKAGLVTVRQKVKKEGLLNNAKSITLLNFSTPIPIRNLIHLFPFWHYPFPFLNPKTPCS